MAVVHRTSSRATWGSGRPKKSSPGPTSRCTTRPPVAVISRTSLSVRIRLTRPRSVDRQRPGRAAAYSRNRDPPPRRAMEHSRHRLALASVSRQPRSPRAQSHGGSGSRASSAPASRTARMSLNKMARTSGLSTPWRSNRRLVWLSEVTQPSRATTRWPRRANQVASRPEPAPRSTTTAFGGIRRRDHFANDEPQRGISLLRSRKTSFQSATCVRTPRIQPSMRRSPSQGSTGWNAGSGTRHPGP